MQRILSTWISMIPETNLNWFAFEDLVGFVRGEVAAYPMTKCGSRVFGSLGVGVISAVIIESVDWHADADLYMLDIKSK